MARKLNQTVLAGGVVYPAGTPEGDVDVAVPDQFWDGDAASPETGSKSYSAMKVDELKAEIEARNVDRDPEGDRYLSADGKKADLVAVLEADDEA